MWVNAAGETLPTVLGYWRSVDPDLGARVAKGLSG